MLVMVVAPPGPPGRVSVLARCGWLGRGPVVPPDARGLRIRLLLLCLLAAGSSERNLSLARLRPLLGSSRFDIYGGALGPEIGSIWFLALNCGLLTLALL